MGSHGIGLMESSTNLQGGDKGRKIITTRRRRRRRRALSTLNKNILQVPYAFKNKSLSSSSSSKRRSRNAVICNKADKKPHMMMMIQEEKKPETIIIDEFNEAMLMEEAEEEEEEDIVMEDSDLASDKEGVVDIDTCDEKNPLAVVEYIDDIYKFYKETERLSCVPPDYMEKQKDLTEKIRGILIDWLIKVHCSFGMMDETLYLTVNVIDRFFAVRQIVREEIQLVGVTALLLACKYENSSVPNRLFSFAERYYARRQVLDMEKLMANTLQFKFSLPTPYVFMKRFLKAAQSDKKLEDLSFLIMELCLVEYEMVKYTPSKLAASAIYTAQCTLNGYKEWSETCKFHTGYNEEDLIECARKMVGLHGKAGTGKLTRVHRKYNTTKFCYAARTEAALFLML